MKKNIVVVMGGDSPERDISVITGVQAIKNIDASKFRVYPVLLRDGKFFYGEGLSDIGAFRAEKLPAAEAVFAGGGLYARRPPRRLRRHPSPEGNLSFVTDVDCVLLCTHGGGGEDGSLQGYFQVLGVPYTSPSVEACAICMNKLLAKRIFDGLKLKQVPYLGVKLENFAENPEKTLDGIEKKLPYPVIVKPASLGSSIGIKTAENREELAFALSVAFEFDGVAVVEKRLTEFVEINCAAAKIGGEITLSSIEKPVGWQQFLTFEDKYTGGKMGGMTRELPANLPPSQAEAVRQITEKIYKSLGLSGVVRMDFLVDKNENVFINEVNTIPGSLAFYLFEDKGIAYRDLLSAVIFEAISAQTDRKKFKNKFESDVLSKFSLAGGKGKML